MFTCAGSCCWGRGGEAEIPAELPPETEQPIIDLNDTYRNLTMRNVLEAYHDAQQALDLAMSLFSTGYLPMAPTVSAARSTSTSAPPLSPRTRPSVSTSTCTSAKPGSPWWATQAT